MAEKYKEQSTIRAWLKQQALTADNTSENDSPPTVWPYMYFFHCLSDQEAAIEIVIKVIEDAEERKEKARSEWESQNRLSTNMDVIGAEMRLESQAIEHEEVQDIFAGTLFVMLNSLLWSMASRIKARGGEDVPKAAGRKIGETSLFELIRAAGNNFRHYDQWVGEQPTDKQTAQNISVLTAAGLSGPWNNNLCAEVLKVIGWKDTETLSKEIRFLATEIFQQQTKLTL